MNNILFFIVIFCILAMIKDFYHFVKCWVTHSNFNASTSHLVFIGLYLSFIITYFCRLM